MQHQMRRDVKSSCIQHMHYCHGEAYDYCHGEAYDYCYGEAYDYVTVQHMIATMVMCK